jgi:hypothetical protein
VWDAVIDGRASSDIIILGSSRALVHYDCSIIIDSNPKYDTCMNLGQNASNVDVQQVMLKTYIKHNAAPKTIILNIDPKTLEETGIGHGKAYHPYQFTPFLDDEAVSEIIYKDRNLLLSKYIPLFEFLVFKPNRDIFIRQLFNQQLTPQYRKDRDMFGFQYKTTKWDGSFERFINEYPDGQEIQVSERMIRYLEENIQLAKSTGARVLLVYSPEYQEVYEYFLNRSDIFEEYNRISNKYDVELIDYSGSDITSKREYFYNSQHLRGPGAELFSLDLADRI